MKLPNRRLVVGFAGVVGLASLLLVLALGYTGSPSTQATSFCVPGPTPTPTGPACRTEMSMLVEGLSGGSAVACDSNSVSACSLDPNSAFTLTIVPKTIPPGGYGFWQTLINYGTLDYNPRASASDEIIWDLSFLPLRAPDPIMGNEGSVGHGDLSNFFDPPQSTQKTGLLELDFNCTAAGTGDTLTMTGFDVTPDGSLFGRVEANDTFLPALSSLEINCEPPPPPPTATATATPCPVGKVPANGGCGTPTDTPEVPPTATAPPPPENVCGDVNGSEAVDSRDALLLLQFTAGLIGELPVEKVGDLNDDGAVDSRDAALVLQFDAGLLNALTC